MVDRAHRTISLGQRGLGGSPSLLLRGTPESQGRFQLLSASILLDSAAYTEEGEGPQGLVGWAGVGGFR